MNKNTLTAAAAVSATILAVFFLVRQFMGPQVDVGPYSAAGEVLAENVSKLLQHRGEIVVVREDPGPGKDDAVDAQIAGMRRGFKRAGAISIGAIETVTLDGMTRFATGGAVPPDQLRQLRSKHSSKSAMVVLLGVSSLDEATVAELRKGSLPIAVLSGCLPGYREMVRAGLIQVAVVPNGASIESAPPDGKSLQEKFDRYYLLATPATADKLPY